MKITRDTHRRKKHDTRVIFDMQFERRQRDNEQTYMKTEGFYSRVFWIFLANVIKIDPYNFELYRSTVGAFF